MAARVPAALRRAGSAVRGRPRLPARFSPRRSRLVVFLGLLGPGLIAANAGNDAGGIATYSSVGAKYGYELLWMMVLITVSLAIVQSMAARMGTVTGKGLPELIRENYGIRWSAFATLAVLIANFGICISDFVGVGAALGLAGIPVQVTVPIAALGIWLMCSEPACWPARSCRSPPATSSRNRSASRRGSATRPARHPSSSASSP
jgi:hypothetical protein